MNKVQKLVAVGAIAASSLAGGALAGGVLTGTAGAAETTTTVAPAAAAAPAAGQAQRDPSQGGHQANGITETLLTGDQKTKAEAAATAAVPGGTIERSETDAEGDAFEVHMTKADGSEVTVKLDDAFTVVNVETGR